MVPVRRNQNWLPSIFNDFLGNDWLAERHNTTAPAVNIIENVVREKIAAKVENGVMTIEIPKKKETEAAVAARQIEVR